MPMLYHVLNVLASGTTIDRVNSIINHINNMIEWETPIRQMIKSGHVMESAHYFLDGVLYSVSVRKLKKQPKQVKEFQ
jgi:hypothetical protein